MSENFIEQLWALGPQFVQGTPHSKEIGMKFVAIDIGRATLSLPYSDNIIGNPDTSVLHGGAITSLLDQASGMAAISAFKSLRGVATLSLTLDYMRAAKPGETIIASAHCYKVTRHVAFVRAIAHDGNENDPVATCQAKFMATQKRDKGDPQFGEFLK